MEVEEAMLQLHNDLVAVRSMQGRRDTRDTEGIIAGLASDVQRVHAARAAEHAAEERRYYRGTHTGTQSQG